MRTKPRKPCDFRHLRGFSCFRENSLSHTFSYVLRVHFPLVKIGVSPTATTVSGVFVTKGKIAFCASGYNSHSWFLTETFAALRDRGVEAFNFLGVAFHVAVWIPAIVLCAGSFIRSTRMVQLASVLGIVLLLAGLLLAVILTGEWNLIHPVNGYICIGYWGDLILFAVCALLSSSKMGSLK